MGRVLVIWRQMRDKERRRGWKREGGRNERREEKRNEKMSGDTSALV
jgi:hypothetical protein